jgi:hypothetical protein
MWLQKPVIDEWMKQAPVFDSKLGASLTIRVVFACWIAGPMVKKRGYEQREVQPERS